MEKKAFKVKPYKWWSLKAWRCAKLVEEFSGWLYEHPEEIEAVVRRYIITLQEPVGENEE